MEAQEIVQKMMSGDAFSQWLGIKVIAVQPGSCQLEMQLQKEMVNGFTIAHGGIAYSLADSALAFAANGYGKKCVSIETSISHVRPVLIDDVLTATCEEKHRGRTIGIYEVIVRNQHEKTVALFKGTVYISEDDWE